MPAPPRVAGYDVARHPAAVRKRESLAAKLPGQQRLVAVGVAFE